MVISIDRFKAIAVIDPKRADALVAKALGWEHRPEKAHTNPEGWWRDGIPRESRAGRILVEPPPYWSCAADAQDRWRWRGEMFDALARLNADAGRDGYAAAFAFVGWQLCNAPDNISHALCLALVAAGMVKEDSDGE